MTTGQNNSDVRPLEAILADMKKALARLDELQAPSDVGAHLSLAIARLEKAITQRLLRK